MRQNTPVAIALCLLAALLQTRLCLAADANKAGRADPSSERYTGIDVEIRIELGKPVDKNFGALVPSGRAFEKTFKEQIRYPIKAARNNYIGIPRETRVRLTPEIEHVAGGSWVTIRLQIVGSVVDIKKSGVPGIPDIQQGEYHLEETLHVPDGEVVQGALQGSVVDFKEVVMGTTPGTRLEISRPVQMPISVPVRVWVRIIPWARVLPVPLKKQDTSEGCARASVLMTIGYHCPGLHVDPDRARQEVPDLAHILDVERAVSNLTDGKVEGDWFRNDARWLEILKVNISRGSPIIARIPKSDRLPWWSPETYGTYRGAHFIVLCGLTSDEKVICNDPVDDTQRFTAAKDEFADAWDGQGVVVEKIQVNLLASQALAASGVLKREIAVEFVNVPLADVVKYLEQITGLKVTLQDGAASDGAPLITLKATAPLDSLLNAVCRQVGLGWRLEGDTIVLGKPEISYVTKVYPVGDIVRRMGGGGAMGTQKLLRLIVENCSPRAGGVSAPGGSIELHPDGRLVVRHTREVHAQIKRLLRQLRAGHDTAPRPTPSAPQR